MLAMLNAVTGADYTMDTVLLCGERVFNLERLFNLKAGITKEDDTLPRRLLEEPVPDGRAQGSVSGVLQMLPDYYQLRGWDENGVPTPEKLSQLGLEVEL
jgi:aldehyde:ferredoxin oxidoreductase